MTTPLNNIKDVQQLNYVLQAVARADYELAIARHRLPYLFPNTKDACNALTFAREPLEQFMRDGLRIIGESESTKELNR